MEEQKGAKQNWPELLGILWITMAMFACANSLQPLMPIIRQEFGLTQSTVALVMTSTILPMGFAPVFYGLALNAFSLRRIVLVSICVAALSLVPAFFTQNFGILIGARITQGLATPAIMLALLTYISQNYQGAGLQRVMILYGVASMLGGFGGRIFAGYVASVWTWRWAMLFLALFLACSAFGVVFLKAGGKGSFTIMPLSAIGKTLREKNLWKVLLIAPLCVFANSSVLNTMPFRLMEISSGVNALDIGLVYLTVLFCSIPGFYSTRIIQFFRGEFKLIITALVLFNCCVPLLALTSMESYLWVFLGINLGFSMVYLCMPGIINRISHEEKSVTNGIYLSMYYLGSASGSYIPLLVYDHATYSVYLAFIMLFSLGALLLAFHTRKYALG